MRFFGLSLSGSAPDRSPPAGGALYSKEPTIEPGRGRKKIVKRKEKYDSF
jgi:hypothetical protein